AQDGRRPRDGEEPRDPAFGRRSRRAHRQGRDPRRAQRHRLGEEGLRVAEDQKLNAPLFSAAGEKRGNEALPASLFGAPQRGAAVHQAVVAALANARQGTAQTRNRSRVSGGGAKPWRQKGTGRARQGSIRAPHWRHGAVVFGPNGRKYDQRAPKKLRQAALAAALSAAAAEGRVAVLEELR